MRSLLANKHPNDPIIREIRPQDLEARLDPINDLALDDSVRAAWRELASQGKNGEPFFQPEWIEAFAGSFGKGKQHLLLSAWREGTLSGIAPLSRSGVFFGKIPARAYRSLSGIHSCRYDILLDDSDPERASKAMWRRLAVDQWWDVIEAQDVPADGDFFRLMRHANASGFITGVWPTRKMPFIKIPDRDKDPFSNCPKYSKKDRSRMKSKLIKLNSEGRVSFDVIESNHERALKEFIDLEASGWKGDNGSAIASNSTTRRFYELTTTGLAPRGLVRIYEMRFNDKLIASDLGFLMNGVFFSVKVAYDESFSRYSPGQLLNRHIIEDLWENGSTTFDLMGTRMPYKMVWTTEVREHSHCYIFRPSLKGRLLHTATMRGGRALRGLKYRVWGDPQGVGEKP